jgi:hypothetical protein
VATPYDAPIPGAPGYATTALQAKTAYQNALARINSKRQDTLRQYGYLGDIDPTTGVVNNVRVDPYNQYGGLQQMLRNNAQAVQDAEFAAEERGLHGGLAHKAMSDVRYDLGNASQSLGSAFAGALGGFQDEQSQAAYDRDRALYEAELQAARDAIANGDFNPADYSDTNYNDPGDNGNPSGGDQTSPGLGPTRKIGGIRVPESAFWALKGFTPPNPADERAANAAAKLAAVAAAKKRSAAAPKLGGSVQAIPHDMRPAPKPAPKKKGGK